MSQRRGTSRSALVAGIAALVLSAACVDSGAAGGSVGVAEDEERPKDISTLEVREGVVGTLEPVGDAPPSTAEATPVPTGDVALPTEGTGEPSGQASDGTPATSADVVPAGVAGETNGWQVVVHSLTDPLAPASEFIGPDEGQRYVGLDVEVTNLDDASRTFSSLFSLDLRLADGTELEVEVGTLHDPRAPSGEVKPGQTLRGLVVFQLPQPVDPAEGVLVLGNRFASADPLEFAIPTP